MRKILAIIIGFVSVFFISSVKINAATPNYSTSITDTSSIAEDFKSMNLNLNGYVCHTPENYTDYFYEKNTFTLVDFQVSKLNEEEARIYLYVYCPLKYVRSTNDYIEVFFASFDIENYEFENTWDHQNFNSKELAYDDVHGIFKLRCNKFKFSDSNKISITSIMGDMALVM
ncbi:MAG: hypothetical protein K2H06_04295, partial [Anaeroplasmataceae bacterium]|nr:hypothetical protein [Anaeroplasmataceae bacterium]